MNARRLALSTIAAALVCAVVIPAHGQPDPTSRAFTDLRDRAVRDGQVRVLVEVGARESFRPEGRLGRPGALAQRARIGAVRQRVLNRLGARGIRPARQFDTVPFVAIEADAATLDALSTDVDVKSIHVDRPFSPTLSESIPLIEADTAHQMGLTGLGEAIAILDTGVDATHPFLAGKVVEEACYSANESGNGGNCPNGASTQVGAGAAVPCTYADDCIHGTHVAGIAAGSGSSFVGVAPGAQLIAIQVFHASSLCGRPCALAWGSDILAGLERVYELRDGYPIASVNLSLGADVYTEPCDDEDPAFTQVIDNLHAAGIATVVAAGNNGATAGIGYPSCISAAVSVGATDDQDQVAWFSNDSADLDLFAPGVSINSSIPGGDYRELSGTSMATPHVAGVWAIMRQAYPTATVDEILTTLKETGRPVTDQRGSTPLTKPRIRVSGAVGVVAPAPVIQTVTPTTVGAYASDTDLTIMGSGFAPGSYALVNGTPRPTTFLDASTLRATVLASDLATQATSLSVSVATPPPGGGSTAAISIAIEPPTFTFSKTEAVPGETVTVSWSSGPTDVASWVSLARVGSADTTYTLWSYVSSLPGKNTWTFVAPSQAGDYEVRLYATTAYNRAASSGPFTVLTPPPPPIGTLSVSATEATVGQNVTVTLTGGSGGAQDWLALSAVGSAGSSYVRWTYVGAGQTNFAWTVAMPTTPGDYEFRLYLNGGVTPAATSPAVHVTQGAPPPGGPTLTVSTQLVTPGSPITVTLAGAPGGAGDWLAFAAVGSPASSYMSYMYIGAGVTSRTWTVTAPSTAGDYEFRFLPNNGYVVTATSPPVTVGAAPPPTTTLTVDQTSIDAGGSVTVTVTGASGSATDWIALAQVGSPDTQYVKWTYLAGGQTTFNWTVTMPTTVGDYEFRLYPNGGYTRAGTSPVVHVTAAAPPPSGPTLTVSTQLVAPGSPITVTLTGGSGGAADWLSFAAVGTSGSSYVTYTYVGAGVTTRTWTVTAPSTAGNYEFRFLPSNGYTVTATSPPVSVQATPPTTTLAVDQTAVAAGGSVTVTVAGASGSATDWLALARVGTPDTQYLQWTYLGAGHTTFNWTVAMPMTAGDYEFRLYPNGGFTRAATSPTVTVEP
jgi:subtilisin